MTWRLDGEGFEVRRALVPPWIWRPALRLLEAALDEQIDSQGHFAADDRMRPELTEIGLHIAREMGFARLHYPPMARFVRPGNGNAAVPPHQDVAYNRHLSRFRAVAWMPLTSIDEESGGIAVYPGSHRYSEFPVKADKLGAWLPAIDVANWLRYELWPLEPGDVVLLHPLVVHESLPNISARVRLSLDFRAFSGVSSKPYVSVLTGEIHARAQ